MQVHYSSLLIVCAVLSTVEAGDPHSWVDELAATGRPWGWAERKVLYEKRFGESYTGSAEQNSKALATMRTADIVYEADAGGRLSTSHAPVDMFTAPPPRFVDPSWTASREDLCSPNNEFSDPIHIRRFKQFGLGHAMHVMESLGVWPYTHLQSHHESLDVELLKAFGSDTPCVGSSRKCEKLPENCFQFTGNERAAWEHDVALDRANLRFYRLDSPDVRRAHRKLCESAHDPLLKLPFCDALQSIERNLGLPPLMP